MFRNVTSVWITSGLLTRGKLRGPPDTASSVTKMLHTEMKVKGGEADLIPDVKTKKQPQVYIVLFFLFFFFRMEIGF